MYTYIEVLTFLKGHDTLILNFVFVFVRWNFKGLNFLTLGIEL